MNKILHTEEIITLRGDDGQTELKHMHEVGLEQAGTKKEWSDALAADGYGEYGNGYTIEEFEAREKN